MFIKSVVSKAGRVVVSADQLRVVLRVVNRLSAERHNAAMYERLRDDFAGYLVSDPDPVRVEKALPVWRERSTGRVVLICGDCYTGADAVHGLRGFRFGATGTGCLDATMFIQAGGCAAYDAGGEACATQLFRSRGVGQ